MALIRQSNGTQKRGALQGIPQLYVSAQRSIIMVTRYRKPNMSLLRSGGVARVIGEPVSSPSTAKTPRLIHDMAKKRLAQYTPAEKELERILNNLGGGALRGTFLREWAFKNWILDFFLYEVRVGIEVDGKYHLTATQRVRDKTKSMDCELAGITLLRITNAEVFGDRDTLVAKLRVAYREGRRRARQNPQ